MASKIEYVSKTQHYLKVKKPLLERQRRVRINKCLDALKVLVAEFQGNDAILRMDKAEMLESTIAFMRSPDAMSVMRPIRNVVPVPMENFRSGYMNAVSEVSRVMASTPGMSVDLGKSVMIHLGSEFNRLLHCENTPNPKEKSKQPKIIKTLSAALMSPASSGYHSDCSEISMASPIQKETTHKKSSVLVWRPW